MKSTLTSTEVHAIESLVKAIFYQTIKVIKKRGLNFGVITPSREIVEYSLELGAKFTFLDEGLDLNNSLSQAMKNLPQNQAILIIMPDLPFFSSECLQVVLTHIKNVEVLIAPSISGGGEKKGTAMLYMNHPDLLPFCFGLRSKNRYIQSARDLGVEYEILDLDPCTRDLDTIADVKYLESHLSFVNEAGIYSRILDHLFK
jgi:2-phospho-L-lactate guanylyltransferase